MLYDKVLLSEGCLFEDGEKLLIAEMATRGMLAEMPSKINKKQEISEQRSVLVPKQTVWEIGRSAENQCLIEWETMSDGGLKASLPVRNVNSVLTLVFSDPIQDIRGNAKLKAADASGKRFSVRDIGGVLTLEIMPDASQSLPFAWVCGDFAVLSADGWRKFDEKQISCNGNFLLDGSEKARAFCKGELVSQGLPFFGGLLTAEKRFTLASDYIGSLDFDGLSVSAAKVCVDGKELGWWWQGRSLSVSLTAGEHLLSIEAASSTYNVYGPHHYYLGDCRLTSPDTFFGKGGYTDNADAPSNTFIDTMQFVKFAVDGDILFFE